MSCHMPAVVSESVALAAGRFYLETPPENIDRMKESTKATISGRLAIWVSEKGIPSDTIELRGFDNPVPDDDDGSDKDLREDSEKLSKEDKNNTLAELSTNYKSNENHSLASDGGGASDSLDQTPDDSASVIGTIEAGTGNGGVALGTAVALGGKIAAMITSIL